MRHKPRLDSTQRAIVEALRTAGCSVQSLASVGGGCPDLLVGVLGATYLLECKTKGEDLRDRQRAWAGMWRGMPPLVVHTPEEALKAVGL
jgi:hypothetical protein